MLGWGEQGVRQNGDTGKRAKVLENDADFLPDTVVTLALQSGEVYVSRSHCLLKAWGHNQLMLKVKCAQIIADEVGEIQEKIEAIEKTRGVHNLRI